MEMEVSANVMCWSRKQDSQDFKISWYGIPIMKELEARCYSEPTRHCLYLVYD